MKGRDIFFIANSLVVRHLENSSFESSTAPQQSKTKSRNILDIYFICNCLSVLYGCDLFRFSLEMKNNCLFIFWIFSCIVTTVDALTLNNNQHGTSTPRVASSTRGQTTIKPMMTSPIVLPSHPLNRRQILNLVTCALVSIQPLLLSPSAAHADKLITNKLASPSALRYVKTSIKVLEKLELYASTNDYEQVKFGLRGPGLDQLRKNASILIGANEEGPVKENLVSQYSAFVQALEKLDSEASLGLRGRKNINMWESYQLCVTSLINFIDSSEKVFQT